MFRLRFPEREVTHWSARYSYPQLETDLLKQCDAVRNTGKLTNSLLYQIARWKSPRRAGRVLGNSEAFVEELTSFALAAKDERARIESLTLLDGVSWPTASVILHLCHQDPYPILDFRALWSFSAEVPDQYAFAFWWDYVSACRSLRDRCGTDMRTLDRALWQFSKEHQPTRMAVASTEGVAKLVNAPTLGAACGSIADAFGTAPSLRTEGDILAQVRAERDEWR